MRKLSIVEMQEIAQKRGGKCLSDNYFNNQTKLKWECKKGHIWEATPAHIKYGKWCPRCIGRGQTIVDMQKLASKKGGICLSQKYISNDTKLEWKCKLGHTWFAVPYSIKQGRWCPICSSNVSERITRAIFEHMFNTKFPKSKPKWLINSKRNKMELDGYNEEIGIAFEYQGIQHYKFNKRFHINTDNLNIRIKDDEDKKKLCLEHKVKLLEIPYTLKFEEIYDFISNQCKSIGIEIPKTLRVNYFELNAFSPNDLNDIKRIAKQHGGKCLSNYYVNKNTKLDFICSKEHYFKSRPETIKRGQWCFKCAHEKIGKSKRLSIDYFRNLIEKKGGKLLQDNYTDNKSKLRVRCENNHIWMVVPYNLQEGHWCPECYHIRRGESSKLGISVFKKIAESKGGECLSDLYINSNSKLKWKCSQGHIWEAVPRHVKEGHWCPTCAIEKRKKSIKI